MNTNASLAAPRRPAALVAVLASVSALLSAGCAAFAQDLDEGEAAPAALVCPAAPADEPVDFGPPEPLVIETSAGSTSIMVEIANDPYEHARGMMFRPDMPRDTGMLFDFGDDRPHSMWMKNTCVSLDIVFLKANGRVSGVARDVPPMSERTTSSPGSVRAVLELPAGRAAEIGLKPGDFVRHERLTLAD